MTAPYRDETETLRARIRALEEANATLAARRGKAKASRVVRPISDPTDAFLLGMLGVLALAGCIGGLADIVAVACGAARYAVGLGLVVGLGIVGAFALRRLWQARP